MRKLHVLLYSAKDGGWVAQCLEHNIMAQSDSIKGAKKEFEFALKAELKFLSEHGMTLDDVAPAPQEFWARYNVANDEITFFMLLKAILLHIFKPVEKPPIFTFTRESRLAG